LNHEGVLYVTVSLLHNFNHLRWLRLPCASVIGRVPYEVQFFFFELVKFNYWWILRLH